MSELARRSGSQILRTFLPQQTVDLRGGIYRVKEWSGARPLEADPAVLRRKILREIRPWEIAGTDHGLGSDLRSGARLEVVALDVDRGVDVERYPEVWLCPACKRIGKTRDKNCKCGARRWGQLHFIGFHSCGAVIEPWIKRCPTHDDVQLVSPKSAKATDIRFRCPQCRIETQRGLGFNRMCACGQGNVTWNVHKARSVYTPRGAALINPPRPDQMRELLASGGGRKALSWVLEGMTARTPGHMGERETWGAMVEKLVTGMNMDRAFAEKLANQAAEAGQLADNAGTDLDVLPADRRATAEDEAVEIAMAIGEHRTSTRDLFDSGAEAVLTRRYAEDYPAAINRAGLAGVDLVEKFPVLNIMFGYSRGGGEAGATRLVPFRNRKGGYRLHGALAETEAFLIRLDPVRTAHWLHNRGHHLPGWAPTDTDSSAARLAIISSADLPSPGDKPKTATVGTDLFTLVHTYAHRVLRQTAVLAGIDRDALSEYLVPSHLGFFVYAAARGDFVLGGLQALFETELNALLDKIVDSEHRCPLDPGCSRGSGACSACLHVGEPSCRAFNTYLDRSALFAKDGFLQEGILSVQN
jgi:hypothetical protein